MDEHVIEAMGKAKIIVKDGKVVDVGDPQIDYCPIFHKYRGIEKLDSESIKDNIEFRINDFGMCSPERNLKMKDFLSFGISETISTLLEEKIVDCAVIVCDGAGTVLITDPEEVQGIGGRISGFMTTSPILRVIETLGESKVLDPVKASINQIDGTKKAIDKGFKNIAVTIASPEDAEKLRELEKSVNGINIYIFAVHVTGISEKEAQKLFDYSDVITSCASKHIREIGEKKALLKVGESIPIFAATENGKKFLLRRVEKIGGLKDKKNARSPEPLI
ncbi:MAG: hypothetical protein CVV28_06315 [Methanobacteriales archaeon HGW-Methanobacteriales-1]|jgi:putative methanogenesis marker protein 8|nr:MAG: hypothetical protein CVV28_06315 [Methanobacteriales archaeon HGW-Methanobacteriales-1]